jgi:hypothetical protein
MREESMPAHPRSTAAPWAHVDDNLEPSPVLFKVMH